MDVIRDFDPWHDPLCTCPKKYGFNPYTGCFYRCVYCYVTSYVPRAFECRIKKNLLKRITRDLKRVDRYRVISMSNSSDPYPPMEAKLKLTRACLELFLREGCQVQVITKSDLVTRDIDLLSKIRCVVSFTITTLKRNLSRKLEPRATARTKVGSYETTLKYWCACEPASRPYYPQPKRHRNRTNRQSRRCRWRQTCNFIDFQTPPR